MTDDELNPHEIEKSITLTVEEEALMRAMLEKSQSLGAERENQLEREILELLRLHIK